MEPGRNQEKPEPGKNLKKTESAGDRLNKRAVGTAYEKQAGKYLEQRGYRIMEYNFRCRSGEIDIIAKDGEYLVFVEVKYRRDTRSGSPLEAVDYKKQRIIGRTASYYCHTHGYGETTPCRFDVVAILGEEIQVIANAFEYAG